MGEIKKYLLIKGKRLKLKVQMQEFTMYLYTLCIDRVLVLRSRPQHNESTK